MNDPTCTLFNLQRFSTEDGPGIRTTLFFKGCPLSCPWCHNPEGMRQDPETVWQAAICMGCGDCTTVCTEQAIHLSDSGVRIERQRCQACGRCVQTCPTGALERIGNDYGVDELLDEVLKDRTFYATSGGGVTFSGGEPLMQHEFLIEFARRCRAETLHIALDTSGVAPVDRLDPLLESVDLVLFDLKLIDAEAHKRLTGVPLDRVLTNLDRIVAAGLPVWIRTPVIPDYTDAEQNLRGIAAYVRTHVPTLERFDLLAFSNLCMAKYTMLGRTFPLEHEPLLTQDTLEHVVDLVRSEGIDCVRWSGPTRTTTVDQTATEAHAR
jgi:pyruvate formate lyase activating enzyme